ncbi:RepB family plasmid replication initiator protein [Azotobacter armeniacus]
MNTSTTDLVVKSNRLIEAGYRLDLIEQRMVLAAIVEARETQTGLSDGYVTLEAKRFCKLFGMRPDSVYGQLKKALNTLYEREITFYDIHPETGARRHNSIRWISSKTYIDGAGAVQMRFAPEIVPYLTRLEAEFTSYRLDRIGRMSSPHAIRLYELLLQYEKLGQRTFTMQEFRQTFQIEDMYEKLSALKRYLLEPAVKQINEFSDLEVSWSERKQGRAVTHLVFDISLKDMRLLAKPDKPAGKPRKAKSKATTLLATRSNAPEWFTLDFIRTHQQRDESLEAAEVRLREQFKLPAMEGS